MKTLIALSLTIGMVCIAFPAPAQAHEEKAWSLNDILNLGSRMLTDAIEKGVAEIQDHVEIDVNTGGGAHEGETSTQLRLKLFPKGKSHSDEEISAETTLKYLLDPRQPYLNFDIRITPKKSALNPEEHI